MGHAVAEGGASGAENGGRAHLHRRAQAHQRRGDCADRSESTLKIEMPPAGFRINAGNAHVIGGLQNDLHDLLGCEAGKRTLHHGDRSGDMRRCVRGALDAAEVGGDPSLRPADLEARHRPWRAHIRHNDLPARRDEIHARGRTGGIRRGVETPVAVGAAGDQHQPVADGGIDAKKARIVRLA